jgi:hypothetical protein
MVEKGKYNGNKGNNKVKLSGSTKGAKFFVHYI